MRLLLISMFVALAACSPRPIKEGAVRFIYYEAGPKDIRQIHREAQPEDFRETENNLARWNADPYVKLYPDYVEIRYTINDAAQDDRIVTHVIPAQSLRFLRWATEPAPHRSPTKKEAAPSH